MTAAIDKVEQIIGAFLLREFEAFPLVRVDVRADDVDAGDSEILLVDVVFDGGGADLDARQLASVVRKVRPALLREGEDRFPVFSFIAKADAERSGRDAGRPH
ncbi:MAG TPA: hypothetical protein VIL72_04325 [Beijerinckiaceae bacterium]|jgi:hypothetical protein